MTRAETLKKDLKKRPRDPVVLMGLAGQLMKAGNYKEARSKYHLALLYNPRLLTQILLELEGILDERRDDIPVRLLLTDLFLYIGDMDSAINELEEVLDMDDKRADVYNILGKLYLKRQKFDEVIKLLERAMGLGIKDISITETLAGTYVEKGRIDDAISLYQGLVGINPGNKNYFRVLGELFERQSKFDDAAKSYMSMLDEGANYVEEVTFKLEGLEKKAAGNIFIKDCLIDVYIKGIKPDRAVTQCREILRLDPGKLDFALKKYNDILYKYPDEPKTLIALGEALIEKGEFTSAAEQFRSLAKYNDNNIDEAIAGYKKILAKYPKQSLAHELLGDTYLRMGQAEGALEEYLQTVRLDGTSGGNIAAKCLRIIKSNPNMMLAHHVLGEAYAASGQFKQAIEEGDFMIYLDKNYAPAYVILGDGHLGTGNVIKAIESYSSAIRLEPFNTVTHEKNRKAHIISFDEEIASIKKRIEGDPWKLGLHLDLAKVHILKGEFDEGVKELQTAAKDNARAPFAYNTLGLAFMEDGRFDLAMIQFEKAIEATPKELHDFEKIVRFNLGSAYEAVGNIESAITEYEKILQEDVEFGALQGRIKVLGNAGPSSLRNKSIAAVIQRLGEKKVIGLWGIDFRTKEVTREALNISFGQDHNNFGYEHFIKGRYRAAEEEFELAIQLDSDFYAALNNLALMYLKSEKVEAAETRINLALSVEPNFAVLSNNLGVLLYMKGDLKGAAEKFETSIEINPNLSSAYLNLGDIYYLQDKCEQALSLWKKVKDFDPLSAIAKRRLAFRTVEP